MSRKKNPNRNAENTPVSPVTHTRRTVLEWLGKSAAVVALPPALASCATKDRDFGCCAETDAPNGGGGPTGGDDTGTRPGDTDTDLECPDGSFEFAPSGG